jgi:hypothetical protein
MRVRTPALLAIAIVAALAAPMPSATARLAVRADLCIERPEDEPQNRVVRDHVEAPKHDELSRWIARNPSRASAATARAAGGTVVRVPTWVHVIRKNTTIEGGNIPRSRIVDQIEVLNDSFAGRTGGARAGFRFSLEGVTRTTKANWFKVTGYGPDLAMKTALKVGGTETLNIYTAKPGANLFGYAYLAQDADEVGVLDGVVVDFNTLPGGSYELWSEGDTATHEVGHWLDLFHTFDGGCEGPGDHVGDTAPEASPAFGCPEGRDTCPGGGLDPITNFMDYTDDGCMFEFTAGQATRMQQAWVAYRA